MAGGFDRQDAPEGKIFVKGVGRASGQRAEVKPGGERARLGGDGRIVTSGEDFVTVETTLTSVRSVSSARERVATPSGSAAEAPRTRARRDRRHDGQPVVRRAWTPA
jgi:hypothetical protein